MDQPLITTAEVAKQLQVSRQTVRQWVRDGRIPAIQITARTFRFDARAVLDALRASPST
jgi:excisionase family DNA binding protein